MPIPSNFNRNPANVQMTFAPNVPNISTGNPTIDQLVSLLLSGSGVAPRPLPGQSVMDSYLARQRSMDMLNSMRTGFANQLVAQKLGGIDPNNGFGSLVSTLLGTPDGIINSPIMRAFNGGNPVRAQMSLMANMTGMNNFMGTGRIGNASYRDVSNVMSGFTDSLFDSQRISPAEIIKQRGYSSQAAAGYLSEDADRLKRWKKAGFVNSDGSFDSQKFEMERKHQVEGKASELSKFAAHEVSEVLKKFDPLKELKNKEGQIIPTKFNFEKSAGFELEDLTSSYTDVQSVGLYNHRLISEQAKLNSYAAHGITPEQYNDPAWRIANASKLRAADDAAARSTASAFADNAPYALRATSDLTGAKTAKEAVEHMNRMFSISGVDGEGNAFVKGSIMNLGDQGDAQFAEKLQRDVKSVARNAGTSVETMLGIIDQAKNLAAAYPGLSSMGGIGVTANALKVFQNAQILAGVAGSDQIRREGGHVQFAQKVQTMDAENRAEPISKGIVSLYGHIAASGNYSDEEKSKMFAQLRDWEQNGRGTAQDNNDRIARLAKAMGVSGGVVSSTMRNQFSRDFGYERMETLTRMGKDQEISGNAGANIKANMLRDYQSRLYPNLIKSGQLKGFGSASDAIAAFESEIQNQGMTAGSPSTANIAAKYHMDRILGMAAPNATQEEKQRLLDNYVNSARMNSHTYKIMHAALLASTNSDTAIDTTMAHRNGSLYAPLTSVLVQEMMSGKKGTELSKLLGSIKDNDVFHRMSAIDDRANKLGDNLGDADAQKNLFLEERGGLDEGSARANMKKQGWTDAQIDAAMGQRKLFDEAHRSAFLKAGAAGLSPQQIMEMSGTAKDGNTKAKLKSLGLSGEDIRLASDFYYHSGLGQSKELGEHFKGVPITADSLGSMLLASRALSFINTQTAQSVQQNYETGAESINSKLRAWDANSNPEVRANAIKAREALNGAGLLDAKGFLTPEGAAKLRGEEHISAETAAKLKDLHITGKYSAASLSSNPQKRREQLMALNEAGYLKDDDYVGGNPTATALKRAMDKLNEDEKVDVAERGLKQFAPEAAMAASATHKSVAAIHGKADELRKAMGLNAKDPVMDKLEKTLSESNGKIDGMSTAITRIATALEALTKVGGA